MLRNLAKKNIFMKISDIVFRQWTMALVYTMLWSATAFAGLGDKILRFSTPGPDRYADGSVVADGECYALVWSPKGKTFSGFNADGTPVSSRDRVVLAGALAQGGKCRDSLFQIPAKDYKDLEGGEWAVCLVDTRMANGVPVGVRDSMPIRVNRWGFISGGVNIADAGSSNLRLAASSATTGGTRSGASNTTGTSGARANILSAVPPNLAPPRITDIEVGDGEVWLAVEGTAPCLSYTVISGETPNDLKTDYFSGTVDGEANSEILIGTPESPKRRFFKVKRAE